MRLASSFLVVLTLVGLSLSGCGKTELEIAAPGKWMAKKVDEVKNLDMPECMVMDPASGNVYISNIAPIEQNYWDDDGRGFLSVMKADGTMENLRWLQSTPEMAVNGPKGMCLLDGVLYYADNARLMRISLEEGSKPEEVKLPKAEKINDLATDGTAVYAADTGLSLIYRVQTDGTSSLVKSPEAPNGLTFHKGKMFGVSWSLHDVYELDPTGKEEPKPFGVSEYFVNLDSIEGLDDGSFILTDFTDNRIWVLGPERTSPSILAELQTPADVWLDREKLILYVPQVLANQATIFQLEKK